MKNRGLIYASITSLLWGFLAIAQKVMLGYLDAVSIVWARFTIAFVFLFIYLAITKPKELSIIKKTPFLIIIGAIGLCVNYIGVIKGLDYTTPNTMQIIIQMAPILFCVTSIIFFKEKVNRIQKFGFLLSAIGLLIFYSGQISEFVNNKDKFNIGFLLITIGAFGWVVYAVIQKILVKKHGPQSLNLILYGLPIIMLVAFTDFKTIINLELWQMGLLFGLGLNTLIAYGLLSEALKLADGNKVSVIITMNPIITISVMTILTIMQVTWIDGEIMSLKSAFGALVLIVGGIVVSVLRKKS